MRLGPPCGLGAEGLLAAAGCSCVRILTHSPRGSGRGQSTLTSTLTLASTADFSM